LIYLIWDEKSHTVVAEEVDHHQVDLEGTKGGDPGTVNLRTIPEAAKLRR
jgi:hypothetical protein